MKPTLSFEFKSKAETLDLLKDNLTQGIIPKQVFFSVEQWKLDKEKVLQQIKTELHSTLLVVRSSAKNEDSASSSMAGNYKSLLNIRLDNDLEIINAINQVSTSYFKDHEMIENDLLIVQEQVTDVLLSGVVFTRCNVTSAPYYIINYDDTSGRTDTVTSGNSAQLKTFTYFKYLDTLPSNVHLRNIIKLTQELEHLTKNDALDLEFALNSDGLYLLQLRPLTNIKEEVYSLDKDIHKTILNIKEFIKANDKKFPNLYGYKAIFGLMPDWNPAEMIGESPKPLAFSLYKELITDYIWPLSRKELGYRDVGYHPGVVSLGGKPYIDVRLSFNTFLPANLSESTSEKLINFYIDKLINNPELHDKIEFKIVHTCYKVGFEKEEQEMRQNNFSPLQLKEIREALIAFTNDILHEKNVSLHHELDLNKELEMRRKKIMQSEISYDIKIAQLLHDCKYYGTLPFAKLARLAFISTNILESLVENKYLTKEDKNQLFLSLNSVAKEFLHHLHLLKNNKITKEEFLETFGHLRPGTYDICSATYKDAFEEYFTLDKSAYEEEQPEFFLDKTTLNILDQALEKSSIFVTAEQFFEFARKSISARETSKFEFTKNLSLILDYSEKYLSEFGFTKEEISFLEISDITHFSYTSKSLNYLEYLKEKIMLNKEKYLLTKALKMPPLVYMEKSVEYFHQFDNKPNFITDKTIVGDLIYLENNISPLDLENKIVLILHADPGYDWIFGHHIKGLITKYGGVASHMSLRCAEFGLPAAIGCGSTIFDYIKTFKKVELNAQTQQIKGIL